MIAQEVPMIDFSEFAQWTVSYTVEQTERTFARAAKFNGGTDRAFTRTARLMTLQKVFISIGMFSYFETRVQESYNCKNGSKCIKEKLEEEEEFELKELFIKFECAINVLKHGYGKSYEFLIEYKDGYLPFEVKPRGETFFCEGDVAEMPMLINVNDDFLVGCAKIISEVEAVFNRRPFNR